MNNREWMSIFWREAPLVLFFSPGTGMFVSRIFPSTKKEPSRSEPLYLCIPEGKQPTFKMDWDYHG